MRAGNGLEGKRNAAKLTEAQVISILQESRSNLQTSIAKKWGIDQSTVSDIVHGKTWSYLRDKYLGKRQPS